MFCPLPRVRYATLGYDIIPLQEWFLAALRRRLASLNGSRYDGCMEPLRFAIAAVPLAAYLVMIGLVNFRRQPTMVSGANDLATLGVALTGMALIGPIALFRPEAATAELGDTIWLFLLAFYWLWLALAVMLCRPRIVVYNTTADELRPILSDAVRQLCPSARWAGDSLTLPSLGVQLHLDPTEWMRSVSLVSSGGEQDLAGWRKLSRAISRSLRTTETQTNPRAPLFLAIGVALLLWSITGLMGDPAGVAVAWSEVLAF